ncbi:MAG: hypothetical protein M3273_08305 [Actinomycetota bacterium]|nr:hypothetical protein [Actinomycetota bacterium]
MPQSKTRPLRDDAIIVRFGLMKPAHIRDSVERCRLIRGFYGLSFFGENDLSVYEICAEAQSPHAWIRVARYEAET